MRLRILSDLHLRHHPPPEATEPSGPGGPPADLVVLAGDIHWGTEGLRWARRAFPEVPVVYVAGNHEHYDRHLDTTRPALKRAGSPLCEIDRQGASARGTYVLERASVTIGDVRILGCTLWTGFELFKNRRAQAMKACRANMDDYERIHLLRARRPLRPRDTARTHHTAVQWLREQFDEPPRPDLRTTVVVTHHPPSVRSVDPRYADSLTSAAFVARRGRLVRRSGAALWVHGHVHASFDYRLGETRVVANPRGHGDENPSFDPGLVVEV